MFNIIPHLFITKPTHIHPNKLRVRFINNRFSQNGCRIRTPCFFKQSGKNLLQFIAPDFLTSYYYRLLSQLKHRKCFIDCFLKSIFILFIRRNRVIAWHSTFCVQHIPWQFNINRSFMLNASANDSVNFVWGSCSILKLAGCNR